MSQIYLSFSAGDEKPLLEHIVNIATQDADKRRWPCKVAQTLNDLPGVPIQAGKRDGTRIIPGDGEKENLIYIDADATYDFTLQWALIDDDAPPQTHRPDAWLPFPTVAKQGGKIYQTFLDFRSLRLKTDAPAILLPLKGSAFLTVPRVIIQILENGTRMMIMQRRLPQGCYHSNGKLARYITQEINDYTACLKVGKKQGGAILPVDSADENLIYVEPGLPATQPLNGECGIDG
ncbi:MAG: hypothetical protein ACMX3H_14205 [Sodalis sp. (in: enterobacteria)]|uniref:hypothetical protein n=1 Tax=Sodalis sp. (in: enterobacteria) TaxID=1898979 RepID=UPI0039E599BA